MRSTTAILPAAFALALLSATMAVPACAHVNSPGGFVSCMADQKDNAVLGQALRDILDLPNYDPLVDDLVKLAPDAVYCLLKREGARKGAGPADDLRSKRAREYLESHGRQSTLLRSGSKPPGATLAGICPNGCSARTATVHVDRAATVHIDGAPRESLSAITKTCAYYLPATGACLRAPPIAI